MARSKTKADVQQRLDKVEAKRVKIKELVAQGKSLDEIKAAVGDPPPAQGRGRGPGFASFTDVVYQELTKKTPLADRAFSNATAESSCAGSTAIVAGF